MAALLLVAQGAAVGPAARRCIPRPNRLRADRRRNLCRRCVDDHQRPHDARHRNHSRNRRAHAHQRHRLRAVSIRGDIFRYIWDGASRAPGSKSLSLTFPDDARSPRFAATARSGPASPRRLCAYDYRRAAEALYFPGDARGESIVWMKSVSSFSRPARSSSCLRLLDIEKLPRQRILLYAWSPLRCGIRRRSAISMRR